jgi:ribonuclease Z
VDLSVVFLGTGGSVPSARRATACVLVRAGGDRILFDCGEGAQRQMQRSTGLVQVHAIYLTHYHADHFLGLPGLLKTYDLNDRSEPLRIYGPPGLTDLFTTLGRIIGRLGYELDLVELQPDDVVEYGDYEIAPFEVEHRARAFGYAFGEHDRPGHLDVEKAEALGVPAGPELGKLTKGETVQGSAGPVAPEQVIGEARRGRRIVITGDTRPCTNTKLAAEGAHLLIHDASFGDEDVARAEETSHSTARQAAAIAADAEARMLALVHISSRYDVRSILAEAREDFESTVAPRDFDVIEIPFPERGEPTLIEGGARAPRD